MQQAPSPEQIERTFQEVLSAPEFRPVSESLMVRALRIVRDAVGRVWDLLFPEGLEVGPMEWVARAVAAAAVLSVVVLIVKAVRTRSRGTTRSVARSREPEPRDAAGWVRWSRERSAEGRRREAATGLYQAALLQLDSRGLLAYREWKTPGDYADEVPAEDPAGSTFREFLRAFLSIAFGANEADEASVAALERRVLSLGVRV